MSDLRTAAQQALEALYRAREFTELYDTEHAASVNEQCHDTITALRAALAQDLQVEPVQEPVAVTDDMRSAVRWAPSSAYWSERLREFFGPDAREGIDALERRLAEAQEPEGGGNLPPPLQAEPIAWLQPKTVDGYSRPDLGYETCSKTDYGAFQVYRVPPKAEPVQEPVAWVNQANLASARIARDRGGQGDTHTWSETRSDYHGVPLYTAPPRRTMVPLTEEEIWALYFSLLSDDLDRSERVDFARAVEKASWEKNK